jgi:potassium-transporting ATPase KdpC subunit
MRRNLISSAIAIIVLTVLLGLVYPFAMAGISQVIFPGRANGSLVKVAGKVVGSRLIGQDFRKPVIGKNGKPEMSGGKPVLAADPAYFQERPSTATSYNAAGSSFTNLGPNSITARDTFEANLQAYLKLERPYDPGLTAARVPIDAATSSASGVDPQISLANADIQAHRVAAVRHLSLAAVDKLIRQNINGRFLGVLGEAGVNVLDLNLALDRLTGAKN